MPTTNDEWFQEGKRLANEGKTEEAIACYDKAIEIDPKKGNPYYYKAFVFPQNKHEEKRAIYQQALDVGADSIEYAHHGLGCCYLGLGKLEDSIKHFVTAIIELKSTAAGIMNTLPIVGLLYAELGNHEEARRYYQMCIERGTQVSSTKMYQGQLFLKEGKYEEALQALEEGLKLRTNNLEIIALIASTHKILKNNEKSLEYYAKVIKLEPSMPIEWCHRGLAHIALGKREEGLKDLRTAKEKLENIKNFTYTPGYLKFMKESISSILEAEELGTEAKTVEEKLDLKNPVALKFLGNLKKIQEKKEIVQGKLMNQLGHGNMSQASANIDELTRLKQEFRAEMTAMKQEMSQVKQDVKTIDNKVTKLETNMEAMKEELNNKLDDFFKKLSTELDKQDFTPEEKAKLNEYFKAFIGTISSIHVTSQVIDSGQVQVDGSSSATTILSAIASFAPFVGNTLSKGITSISEFVKTKEIKSNARVVKRLAPDAVSLSQLLGKAAYNIVTDKKKQQQILQVTDQDMNKISGNLFQKILSFCKNLDEEVDAYLYTELYKTAAERLAHDDANRVIGKWIEGVITPFTLEERFVKEALSQEDDKETRVDSIDAKTNNRSACCNMF